MEDILNNFNQYPQIKIRHVFTNCLLTPQLVNDYTCNKFVQEWLRPQDEVILNHPLLIEHFKQNYPNIPIIYSTTMGITDINKINEISKDNIFVLNYNYNNDNNYLNQLENKQNIEILCAEPCRFGCKNRQQHYITISKLILDEPLDYEDIDSCPFGSELNTLVDIMKLPHAITNARLDELEAQGFQYFKISGRTLPVPLWLETILYYLALPEYIDLIRQYLLMRWW